MSDQDKLQLDSTSEIIEYIHKRSEEGHDRYDPWVCAKEAKHYNNEYVAECKEWADAAYKGDWDEIFKIVARRPDDLEGKANVVRFLPENARSTKLSGYTVLHQAAYYNASKKVVEALIKLGCYRQIHSTDGRSQRPVDIARASGFTEIIDILEPPEDKIPNISDETLQKIQEHLNKLVIERARGLFEPDMIRFPDLAILREIDKIWMPIPGMYGGFKIWFEGDKLVTESFCRVVGGSGVTHNIDADGATVVEEGWG